MVSNCYHKKWAELRRECNLAMAADDNTAPFSWDLSYQTGAALQNRGAGNNHQYKDGSGHFRRKYLGEEAPKVIRTGGVTGTLPPISRNSPATTSATPTPVVSATSVSQSSPTSTVSTSTITTAIVASAAVTESNPVTSQAVPNTTDAPPSSDGHKRSDDNMKPFSRPIGHKQKSFVTKPLPSEDVLVALFDRLMTRMKLPPERVTELNTRTPQQKWSMILSQSEIESGIACVFYIEQLVRHTQPDLKEKRPKKRLLLNLQPLSKVLKDLEEDIRTNPNDSWVKDFVNSPNHGHVALVDLIKDIVDNSSTITRKNPKKYAMLDRDPNCLYTALLCLKALMGHRKALGAILKYDPSLCVLAYCLDSSDVKVKILILKIFVTVLLVPGGHRKVMQAFDYFRAVMKEKMRFQILMSSLTRSPVDTDYQASLLCFINTVVQTAPNPNSKTFHQTEFLEAGFNSDDVEKSLRGRQDERVLHEIKEWRKNFIDVQSIMDDLVICKGKIRSTEAELTTTHKHLKEANADRESLYKQIKSWIDKYDKQKQKVSEMTSTINELQAMKKERDCLLEEKKELLEAKTTYRAHTSELKERVQQLLDENKALLNREILVQEQVDSINKHQTPLAIDTDSDHGSSPTTTPTSPIPPDSLALQPEITVPPEDPLLPPLPPPPPPPPPFNFGIDDPSIPPPPPIPFGVPPPPPPPIGGFSMPKRAIVSHVPLPMLNWLPIENPEHTIFKDMDDEGIIETVDFSEFENLFQKKTPQKKKTATKSIKKTKAAEVFHIIESNRSRNLNIAQRRIGLSPAIIARAVETSDLDTLNSENCELLLKFIPAEKEVKDLEHNKDKLDRFGEAELILHVVSKVERYEARLQCMTYIGTFDETIKSVQPQINAVSTAALSILRSTRLKKVFEIILAFGNYMNSSRKGAAHGFRLESLTKISETKSQDKKQTLLSYIAHVVEKVFPNVLTFHEDLDVLNACSVSKALISEDVSNLRNGRKIIEAEIEKDPQNFIIFSFHMQTCKKMEHLEDSYSKMEHSYREVLLMFSENPDTTEPSDFFKIFSNFTSNWKDAVKKNRKSKKVQMGSTMDLLRKQQEEERQITYDMKSLAAEVAAIASARSENIRRKVLQKKGDREVKSDGEDEEDGGDMENNGWLMKYSTTSQRTDRSGLSNSRSYSYELDKEQYQSGFDSSRKDDRAQDSDYYDHINDSGTDSDR